MPFDIGSTVGQIVGTGMGLLMEKHNDKRQIKQQEKLQDLQIKGNKELTDYQKQKDLEMWKATNYGPQMEELRKAGLNPGLIYGMSGGGGVTTGGGGGSVSGGQAPSGGGEVLAMQQMGLQLQMQKAQIDNMNADTKKKEVEAENLGEGGASRENIKADTAVKVAEQIIKDYTGKDMKISYDIRKEWKGTENKLWADEITARQGIAQTIGEMWQEGKLKDMSVAQLESLLASNDKTRAETRNIKKTLDILDENLKGAKLDNVIKDLESKLQTQTGIDSKSPYWLKILGRLFITLMEE